jgi:2-phosphosulfolactate phosphatase
MPPVMEVLFSPAEFEALARRDLSRTTCVVFDVLRATSSMITALAHGAAAILPAQTIPQALALRDQHPEALLAGERHGLRIDAKLTGGIDFDLGNSPREFTPERVRNRTVIMTTTNGTRALQAVAPAQRVLIGSLLNLSATASFLASLASGPILLVCSGTNEEASFEDTLGAGALCAALSKLQIQRTDSVEMAQQLFQRWESDLAGAMAHAQNGRRLLAMPELAADVPFCLQRDLFQITAELRDGAVRVIS